MTRQLQENLEMCLTDQQIACQRRDADRLQRSLCRSRSS